MVARYGHFTLDELRGAVETSQLMNRAGPAGLARRHRTGGALHSILEIL